MANHNTRFMSRLVRDLRGATKLGKKDKVKQLESKIEREKRAKYLSIYCASHPASCASELAELRTFQR